MDRTQKIGAFFVALFGLPFAGFGLFALRLALLWLVEGSPPGKPPFWMPLIFGTVFSTVGFGLMFVAVWGGRKVTQQQQRQAEHPTEPWLWREDWAQGRVPSKTRNDTIGAWIFAILWNLVSAPMLYFIPPELARKPALYIAFLFPVVGVFLLVRAIRQSLAYAAFGKTYFEMTSVPGVIGGELTGAVEGRFPHSPEQGILLRLTCIHRVTTGSGDSQSTSEQILWRDERTLSPAEVCAGPSAASFPVSFRIPWDAQPTEKKSSSNEFVWLLEALADVPGVNYHDIFEVPVFRTSQTPAQPEPPSAFAAVAAPRPSLTAVDVRQDSSGTEFFFPAARNKGSAIYATLLLMFFLGLTAFLYRVHLPLIFVFGCGLFCLLLIYIVMQLWFGTSRVVIGGDGLTLQEGMLGGGKIQQVPFSEISDIAIKVQTQQGGATGTPLYDIQLRRRNGRTLTLGRAIRNKAEADWLVAEMRRLTGLQTKAAAFGQ